MGIREKVVHTLALPKDIALDMPLIIGTGRSELTVENYKSLLEFTEGQIRVITAAGLVTIKGERLKLKQITSESLLIIGTVEAVNWT